MCKLWMHSPYDIGIFLWFPNTSNNNHIRTCFLAITTLFLASLVARFHQNHPFFQFEISLPQTSKQKEIYFATRKILRNFEKYDHWHCRHLTFWVIYSFLNCAKQWQTKYGHLMLVRAFSGKVTPETDFTDDVPVVKIFNVLFQELILIMVLVF